jgi:hypothetical protein
MGAGIRFHRELNQGDTLLPILMHDADGEIGTALPLRDEVVLD